MDDSLKKVILRLYDAGVFEFGLFSFKHHEADPTAPLAPMKINLRTPNHPTEPGKITPTLVFAIALQFCKLIDRENFEFDHIAGIPQDGEPFAKSMAKVLDKPFIGAEKIEVDGKRKINRLALPSSIKSGRRVLVIDDVITKGWSKQEIFNLLEKDGLQVAALVVFADREEGGMEFYRNLGYKIFSVITITEILDLGLLKAKISSIQYQKCIDYLDFSRKSS